MTFDPRDRCSRDHVLRTEAEAFCAPTRAADLVAIADYVTALETAAVGSTVLTVVGPILWCRLCGAFWMYDPSLLTLNEAATLLKHGACCPMRREDDACS